MPEMTEALRRRLESQLGEQLRQDCEESERIGYPPRVFRRMLSESGAVGACRHVIMSRKIPDGFLTLLEKKRLDLTAEATVLRGPWKALFSAEELERARKRLRDYERPDLADV
ncbi:hypothetical protein [Rhodoplanes sp. SY1]|uniref:hypothetical protein n=1 Tax=Rhodoplanes sp. SY1 TaxID=3166646 RepID=UPI0038B62458